MNETTALTEIKKTVTPPLTKREIIAATALAMHEKQIEARTKAESEKARLYSVAKATARKIALKLIRKNGFQTTSERLDYDYKKGQMEHYYRFDVTFDYRQLPEWKEWEAFNVPCVESVADIRKALERAGSPDRPNPAEILALPGVREKLIELGNRALGIAEAKKPGAIEV